MSFGADLKEFVSSFRDTYKTFKPSWQEQSLAEQRALREAATAAGDKGEASAGYDLTRRGAVDTGDTPTEGYNPRGKAPAFTTAKFDTIAPRLINDLSSELGLPEHAAQGFVGRLGAETGGFSTLQEINPSVPGSRGGFGYAQWTGPRRVAFEKYVDANKLDPASYEANKRFLVHEVKNTAEGKVLQSLLRSRDRQEAGDITEKQFLRPGIPHGRAGARWVDRAGRFSLGVRPAPADVSSTAIDSATGKPIPANDPRLDTSVIDRVHGIGPRAALDTGEDPALLNEQPVVYAARGGVVPSTIAENAGSNPVTRDVMDAAASEDDSYDPQSLVDVEGARRAVEGGLRFGQRMLGLEAHHAAVPGAVQPDGNALKGLAHSVGAASPEELNAVDKTIDPKGKLPPEVREIARYNAQYQFWNRMGEPQKADRAAWSMLSAAKRAASQYGALALATEDPKQRAEVIAKGYNRLVPDGNTMKVTGADKDGAKFEIVDPKGNLTEKGSLAVDDMVQLATGMVNGTQWLQSMIGFATSAPSSAEKKIETERKSVADFENARGTPEDDRDFMNTLSDDQREKFLKMPLSAQKVYRKEHQQRIEQDRKQSNFDKRLEVGAENMDRKEATDLAKTAIRLGMWETTRDQVMTMHEQKLAQLQAQEAGRNTRFDQSQEARRKRQLEIDQRILDKRTADKDGAGVKLTAKERQANAEDAGYAQREAAIQTGAGVGSDEEGAPWTAPAIAAANEQIGISRAERGYRAGLPKDAAKNEADFTTINTALDSVWKDMGKTDPIPPTTKGALSTIAAHMSRANLMSEEQAATLALKASARNVPVRTVPDPDNPQFAQVQIGDTPPVRLGRDALMQIAAIRGGQLNPVGVSDELRQRVSAMPKRGAGAAVQAAPGRTGGGDSPVRGPAIAMDPVADARLRLGVVNDAERRRTRRAIQLHEMGAGYE